MTLRIAQQSRLADNAGDVSGERANDFRYILTHPFTGGLIEDLRIRGDAHEVALGLVVLVQVKAPQVVGLLPTADFVRHPLVRRSFSIDTFVVDVPIRVAEHRSRKVEAGQSLDLRERVVPERVLFPQFTICRRDQVDPAPA